MSDKRKQFALTTFDNPFDPFDNFSDWNDFDKEKGYNSCERLATFTKISDDLTQNEIDLEIERAINEIIKYDFLNIYKKVSKETTVEDETDNYTS